MDNTIGRLIVQVLMDSKQFGPEADKVAKQTSLLGDMLKKLADGIEKAFKFAAVAAAGAATATATAAALIGSSFEQAISKVAAVKGIDKASEDFARLEAEARRLGASTMFTATEAAQGMEELARAGLSTDQIIAASQKTLEMAAGSQISLAESAAIVAASMAQFGIAAEDAGRITDVLTATTQNTLFGMEDLAVAMRYAGTVGAALGMTIEETAAAVAQFRNLGLEGSMAGTNFREAMSSIAKPTDQARAALEKYGLTVRDVNPEINTFRDIMIRVGKAGMTTGDAMTIFGLRTGANVKKIAEEMARSSEQFDELLAKLEGAAGTTATTYEIMTDNVRGAFDAMTSAMQEVLISLFGTFSGPLKDLLGSVTNLFVLVGEEIVRRTGTIGTSIEHTFGNFAAFIDQNAERWAKQIGNILAQVADFAHNLSTRIIPLLWEVLPLIDDIAIAMGSFLAAHKVTLFVGFITGKLIPALVSTTWTLRGVATAMAAATGGMSALAAGVATLVAGLAIMISRLSKARQETIRLQQAQENAARRQGEDDKWRLKRIAFNLAEQQKQARATMEQLQAEEQLTDAVRERLEWVESLTAAEVLRAEKAGEVLANERGEYERISDLLQGSEADRQRVRDYMAKLQQELQRAEKIAQRTTLSGGGLQEEADARARAALRAKELEQTIAGLRTALETYKPVQEDTTAGTDRFADALARFERYGDSATETVSELQRQAESAATDLEDLIVQIRDEMADIGADEEQRAELALARRIDSVRKMRDLALQAEGLTEEQRRKIIDDSEMAIRLLREKHLQEGIAKQRAERAAEERRATEEAVRAEEQRQEEVSRLYEDAIRARLTESERLEREFLLEVLPKLEGESQERRQKIIDHWQARIQAAREAEAKEAVGYFDRLQRAGVAAWRAIGQAMGTLRDGMDAVMRTGQRVLGLIESVTGISFRLSDAMGAVRDAVAQEAEAKGAPLSRGETGLVAAQAAVEFMAGLVEGAAQFAEAMVAALPKILDALVKAIPGIVDAFVEALPKLIDAIVAALPDIVDAIVAAIPDIIDALVEGVPDLIDAVVDAIPRIVLALIDELPKVFDALVAGVVDIIEGILDALPDIITAIMDALPDIVLTLVAGVADVVKAVMEALPDIIDALVIGILEAIPTIVVGIIEAIPDIVLAVIRGIPDIVLAVVRAVPQIVIAVVQMIPDLIAAIIEALPEIITAVILLLPQITVAIIKALPEIVASLWNGIIIEMGRRIGEIAKKIGEAIIQGFKNAAGAVADFFSGLFGGGKGKQDRSSGSAYSGVPYVPATMRMTVHEGEQIVPAHRNPARATGEASDPALAGARVPARAAGRAGFELKVSLGGEVVDRVLVDALSAGHAPRLNHLQRRASGRAVGVYPGNFNKWSK